MRRLSFVAFLLTAGSARADLAVMMTIYGTESGTFQGQAFTNALVTFTARYDVSQVVQTGGGTDAQGRLLPIQWSAPSSDGFVTVAGVGSGSFIGSGSVTSFSSEDLLFVPAGGYFMTFPGGVSGLFGTEGVRFDPHLDRNLAHTTGPIELIYNGPIPTTPYTVQTSAGDLIMTSPMSLNTWTAQIVPEPSSLALLGIGAVTLAGYGRARRHFKQTA
jgi:hypothetical protein